MPRKSVEQVKSELKGVIFKENLPEGTRLDSISTLAGRMAASVVTVQRAVTALAEEGVLTVVHGKGVFVRHLQSASGIRRVGICMNFPTGAEMRELEVAFGEFYYGAQDFFREQGRQVINVLPQELMVTGQGARTLEHLDGLLVAAAVLNDSALAALADFSGPVVVVQHEEIMEYGFHQVVPDLFSGFMAAAALFEPSRHPVVYIATDPANATYGYRVKVFLRALQKCWGERAPRIEYLEQPRIAMDLGRMTGRILGERALACRASAIFSPSDFLSFGIMDTFLAKRLRPGRDFTLVSYDDLESSGVLPFEQPLLTSVSNPRCRISTLAAKLLLDSEHSDGDLSHIVRVPSALKIRQTAF